MKKVWIVTAIAILVPVIAGLEFRRRYYSNTVLAWDPKVAADILAELEIRYTRMKGSRACFEFMALTGLDLTHMKNRYGHCKQYPEWLKQYTKVYHDILTRFED